MTETEACQLVKREGAFSWTTWAITVFGYYLVKKYQTTNAMGFLNSVSHTR